MLLGEALEAMVKSTHIRVTNGKYRNTVGTIHSVMSYWAHYGVLYANSYLTTLDPVQLDSEIQSIEIAVNGKRAGQIKMEWFEILPFPQEQVLIKDQQSATLYDSFGRELKTDQVIAFVKDKEQKVGVINIIAPDGLCEIKTISADPNESKRTNVKLLDGNCIVLDDETQKYLLIEKLKS